MKPTRGIVRRWIIIGQLKLLTPTHLSNGDPDPYIDLPVLLDPLEGRALLTGASLAGALRHYLADYTGLSQTDLSVDLFGGNRRDAHGDQSTIVLEDALGPRPVIELRDGVRINARTRTAADEAKYDRQVLAAGTTFQIGCEVVIGDQSDRATLRRALLAALRGLQNGEIRLGGRKHRGLGECQVTHWQVWDYDLSDLDGLAAWLAHGRGWSETRDPNWVGDDITRWSELTSEVRAVDEMDSRSRFVATAECAIAGSLLIRSGFETERGPDVSHLQSRREGRSVPVVSGTSLAGVLRAQAQRIARTLGLTDAEERIGRLFGSMPLTPDDSTPRRASRVTVSERAITGDWRSLVQSRVKIDRFTGGAAESALFTEQPVFGGQIEVAVEVRDPDPAEIGLLLLVLKDLWTGHLAIGGEASVGRGRLRGRRAELSWMGPDRKLGWTWERGTESEVELIVTGDSPRELSTCVAAFASLAGGTA